MIKKYSVLWCAIIAMMLLTVAIMQYPGGSFVDANSIGFSLKENFISNLFADKAINGMENESKLWAKTAMAFLSVSFAIFFVHFSEKIPSTQSANVIKYVGIASTLFSFLIVTALHDVMVNISGTLSLLCFFYITVYLFRSRLIFFKYLSILFMLINYITMYIYGTGNWLLLAIMQKVVLFSSILFVLGLEYFTNAEDFGKSDIESYNAY